ncbi:MAG: aldehyde dehydrogenase family protein [Bacteroidetes bacterium]|nr:aldehyde dehydrogenase family protein [Bacteroidota bacterium]
MPPHPFFINGEWRTSSVVREVRSPYDGAIAGEVCQATPADIGEAIEAAVSAFRQSRAMASFERSDVLSGAANALSRRKTELAELITRETGKPITYSRAEVDRSVFTFKTAAEEATRMSGEVLPLDLNPGSKGRFALIRRFPIGPISAITPFNFPLNLVAHKVAPAFAAGNTVLLKPSSNAPLVSLLLGRILNECGFPKGCLNILPCAGDEAGQLIEDERIKAISFTGSPAVGWPLKSRAGRKKVTLELGGNAGVIVEPDADQGLACERILSGGFANAGQSCIAVQRVYVHRKIFDHFAADLVPRVAALAVGDPWDEKTVVGPMITEQAARQAEAWVREAVDAGARVLTGGTRKGAVLAPTVLTAVRPSMKVSCMEVFAPVITLDSYEEFSEAVNLVNDSDFGLQAGVFTSNLRSIQEAYERLDVGGVIINDVPTYRMDHMPYGGVKASGFGREGIRYAMEELTELKLLAINPL